MKAKKSILAIFLGAILLVGFLPAQKLDAAWGPGPAPKPPVEVTKPEPAPEPEPKPVEEVKEPEVEKPQETPVHRENAIDDSNVDRQPGAKEVSKEPAVVKAPVVKKYLKISFTVGEDSYMVDSNKVEMDGIPFIYNDRIMIPLRYAAEALQMKVEFDDESQIATFKDEIKTIKINVVTGETTINDHPFEGDTPPQLINDRTYISIGSLAEALGMTREKVDSGNDLSWNQETRTATITKEVK